MLLCQDLTIEKPYSIDIKLIRRVRFFVSVDFKVLSVTADRIFVVLSGLYRFENKGVETTLSISTKVQISPNQFKHTQAGNWSQLHGFS